MLARSSSVRFDVVLNLMRKFAIVIPLLKTICGFSVLKSVLKGKLASQKLFHNSMKLFLDFLVDNCTWYCNIKGRNDFLFKYLSNVFLLSAAVLYCRMD
jgi:hypothetical protein